MINNKVGLDRLIGNGSIKMTDLRENFDLKGKGYIIIDEVAFNNYMSSYISTITGNPQHQVLLFKRDLEGEYNSMKKLNKLLPEHVPEPVAMILDGAKSREYLRGYLLKSDDSTPIREALYIKRKDRTPDMYKEKARIIDSVVEQLKSIKNIHEANGEYNRLPLWTFDADNLRLTSNRKVLLLASNDNISFLDKDKIHIDKSLDKTIHYLNKTGAKYKKNYS
jgi:hypothetical protein